MKKSPAICDGKGRMTACSEGLVEKYPCGGETMRFCEAHSMENKLKREKDLKIWIDSHD